MPAITESLFKGFTAGAALSVGQIVKISTGKLAAAAAADENAIGTLTEASLADGDFVTVQLFDMPRRVKTGGAVTAGAAVKRAADGEVVAATSDDSPCGVALTASGADGDVIEAIISDPHEGITLS